MNFLTSELHQHIEDIFSELKKREIFSAQVHARLENGFSASARMGEAEIIEHHHSQALRLTVYFENHTGSVATSDLSWSSLCEVMDKAVSIAQFTDADPYSGLADPELMAYHYPNLDLYHEWPITPDQGIQKAIACESLAREKNKTLTNTEATVSTYNSYTYYANTHGFQGGFLSSMHTMLCNVVAEGRDEKQEAHEYTNSRNAAHLLAEETLANQVVDKALAQLGAVKISTRKAPVIFLAPLAKSIIGHFISAISGANLYRQDSFLENALGQKIFPNFLSIYQDPLERATFGSAPFDREGVYTRKLPYIDQGILINYVLNSYSARRLNLVTTGNSGGVFNLKVNPTQPSLAALLKKMDTGFLVTDLMGQGVNLLTGNYSRGATGFWVEKGEIQFPVKEVTIAGNLRQMFLNILDIANDLDQRGNIHAGSMLIEEMSIAGS